VRVNDVTALEFVGVSVADESAQRFEMLPPGARLVILFDEWDRHGKHRKW
jgi:hypothetical protein